MTQITPPKWDVPVIVWVYAAVCTLLFFVMLGFQVL